MVHTHTYQHLDVALFAPSHRNGWFILYMVELSSDSNAPRHRREWGSLVVHNHRQKNFIGKLREFGADILSIKRDTPLQYLQGFTLEWREDDEQ